MRIQTPELISTRKNLLDAVASAKATLQTAEMALIKFEDAPENHVYSTLDFAEDAIYSYLEDLAYKDCEGSYNCGNPEYEQEFIVDNVHYLGTLKVEYNRHDKTYYYVEETEFSYKKITE